ncbi:hypothetical protein [Microbacterium pygmaeum]|uniref:Uncharacterized protein n=1 Tax=Microbacterium pygmaeum TaxID=370764 RepID=A0A1G7ZQ87_9MICO|nr:hypothetical protein [Microbacterium pygmaeum]SDH10883.1 hypothetical protein SAMN04489810_2131 [Microbacterium pygmaeum]
MGTNRRYAASVDRQMDERALQRIAASGPLETLSRAEQARDVLPVTSDPRPRIVKAWVRFGATPVQVDAEACMWTAKAVGIRFTVSGTTHRCWVWVGAVDDVAGESR